MHEEMDDIMLCRTAGISDEVVEDTATSKLPKLPRLRNENLTDQKLDERISGLAYLLKMAYGEDGRAE